MEIDREGDVRVPLVFAVFFLSVTAGGVFLFIYVFVPSLSQPWYQSAALFLIAAPWIFWLLTFLYTIMKRCCGPRPPPAADHKISRRPSTTTGKVAVITGGARGIGAATAKAFAENGANVVIADILDEAGAELAAAIGGMYVHCDVSLERDVERAIQAAVGWKGRLDIMFNNAGISGPEGSITSLKMEQLSALLEINLNGVVHGIKHAARAMIEGRIAGTIICSSSSAAMMGGLASHAYTLSKAAILGVARSSACELGVHGIRVNCVSPHGVPSEMLMSSFRRFLGDQNLQPQDVSKIVGETGSLLRGRGGSVEDVAEAAVFLASDNAGFITGHNLVIDGGFTYGSSQMSFIYQTKGHRSMEPHDLENKFSSSV